MSNKNKLIVGGLILTGVGIALTPLFTSKFLIIFNTLAFTALVVWGFLEVHQNKGLSFEDIDMLIDSKIAKYKSEDDIIKIVMYSSIRPIFMLTLAFIIVYVFSYTMFL